MAQSSTIDRKAITEATKAAARKAREMGEVVAGLMGSARGREWVWTQLASCGIFATTYNDNPNRMLFDEGRRASGLALLDQVMQFAPDQFIQAMREANERRTHDDNLPSANGADDSASNPIGGERSDGPEPGRDLEGPIDTVYEPGPIVDENGRVHYQA